MEAARVGVSFDAADREIRPPGKEGTPQARSGTGRVRLLARITEPSLFGPLWVDKFSILHSHRPCDFRREMPDLFAPVRHCGHEIPILRRYA